MFAPGQTCGDAHRQPRGRPRRVAAELLLTPRPLHRIAAVRKSQGISMRAAREFLELHADEVRRQENENCDLLLSDLYLWQRLLDVPLCELLVEPPMQLSRPISERAALVKVMKTATTILETARQPGVQTLARTLTEQLIAIMPELADVAPWPSVGQRRTTQELGRIAEHPYSMAPLENTPDGHPE